MPTLETVVTWIASAALGGVSVVGISLYAARDWLRQTFATRDEVGAVKQTADRDARAAMQAAMDAEKHADGNENRVTRLEERVDGLKQALLGPFDRMNQRMDEMAQSQAATAEATRALTHSVNLLREELRETRRERR